jgi:hypothetical protein
VRRFLLALPLLASACASTGHYHHHCHGHGNSKIDGAFALAELALGALEAGAALTEMSRELPPLPAQDPAPRQVRRLFGTVSWESGGRVPAVKVVLRANSGLFELDTTTDEGGRFWFPWPLPADVYRISIAGEGAVGEKELWLGRHRPSMLDVIARATEPPPAGD